MRILILLFLSALPALAQTQETSTVITSEMFRLDQVHHQGVFTGNVIVNSKDFHMTARELTVYFTAPAAADKSAAAPAPAGQPASRVERLVAKGEVHIESGNRTSTSAQADYTLADDKMVLTGAPKVTQDKDTITGTTITLYRTQNRMEVDGQSRVVLTGMDGAMSPAGAPAKTNPNP